MRTTTDGVGQVRELEILSASRATARESHLAKLASFLGCESRIVPIELGSARAGSAIAISADTLSGASDSAMQRIIDLTRSNETPVLVFGFRAEPAHISIIRELTLEAVTDIRLLGPQTTCHVPIEGQEWTQQLAGSQCEEQLVGPVAGFVVARTAKSLLARGDLATLVFAEVGRSGVYCVSETEVPDIDASVTSDGVYHKWPEILPYIIYLRAAFGDGCWRSSLQTTRLIIDDPLLKQRYGQLRYRNLFESMEAVGYGTTVAFIPWNYRRTSRSNARYFRDHSAGGKFSVCVHGCDHTRAEFAMGSASELEHRAVLALRRLDSQQERTGLGYERVMVFPRGEFSKDAAAALRKTSFAAAISTRVFPVDHAGSIRLRDLLAPAVTCFHGFPLFSRHYPEDPRSRFALALDLYLGRPAFMAGHHDSFVNGTMFVESLVRSLQERSPTLQSLPLTDAVQRSFSRRITPSGEIGIKFLTDRFSIEHPRRYAKTKYTLIKDEPDPEFIQSVEANGFPTPFRRLEGRIELECDLEPGARLDLSINVRSSPRTLITFGRTYQAKVLARRVLSEFRDEVLSHHPATLALAKRLVKLFKAAAKGSASKTGTVEC